MKVKMIENETDELCGSRHPLRHIGVRLVLSVLAKVVRLVLSGFANSDMG